ncbi:MAG: response regulator [Deltaproteobacteria bacterium]|nr:response regulator [Deltaproteobacteria bacterium]
MKTNLKAKSVVVVEDDPTYLHLWGRLIRDAGIQKCATFSNPVDALKFMQKNRVDLLISDILMKEMNGYELATAAKKSNPKIEILLTTGYETDLSRYDLKGLRCHLLHKPYHNLGDVCLLLQTLLKGKNVFEEMDEDSFSENIDNPDVTEWTL